MYAFTLLATTKGSLFAAFFAIAMVLLDKKGSTLVLRHHPMVPYGWIALIACARPICNKKTVQILNFCIPPADSLVGFLILGEWL